MANWKLFERLVAAIHVAEQQGATVKWNEMIKGRQFDVTVRSKLGLYEYLTVVECKDHLNPIAADKIDALVTKSRDAGADKAVMVAASGFQKGAIETAQRHSIRLFTLKALAEISPQNVAGELLPVLWVYDFMFDDDATNKVHMIPEEPGLLRLFLQQMGIRGPSIDTKPELLIEQYRGDITKNATPEPQKMKIELPADSYMVHPNTGERTRITAFSFMYQLISTKYLKTTVGLGINPYLDGPIYKLEDAITKDSLFVDSADLKLGFDTTLEEGKFYINPKMKFSYYCKSVGEDLATVTLVESYQHGRLFQATANIRKPWWWQFVEVTDAKEIERLKRIYEEYLRKTG